MFVLKCLQDSNNVNNNEFEEFDTINDEVLLWLYNWN